MKKISFLAVVALLLFSCSDDFVTDNEISGSNQQYDVNGQNLTQSSRIKTEDDYYWLKKKFAMALHKAMVQNVNLRRFLKEEAIKQFDGDYDILYNYIRDEKIGDKKFREILLPFFEKESELSQIENALGALTIFVPTLPENSFSAQTWNVTEEVPLVALRLLNNRKTPIINSEGQSFLLDENAIPGFPVIVIKESERVVVESFPNYDRNKNREFTAANGFKFKFESPYYNHLTGTGGGAGVDPDKITLAEAWNVNGKHQNLGWQRDYIYYTINPTNPDGPFINNFAETIRDFRIEGSTPYNALHNISDPSSVNNNLSDPDLEDVLIQSGTPSQGSFWTDGKFDFKIYINYNADSPDLVKVFDATPESLFDITYSEKNVGLLWIDLKIYTITDIKQKSLPLDLEVLTWRLHDYSNKWTFRVEEVDLQVKNTSTTSSSTKHNTNFEFEASGELFNVVKIGGKYGASSEETHSSSKTKEWTESSDDLGMTVVHFGDNVIIDEFELVMNLPFIQIKDTIYRLRRYKTNECSFSLVPRKVQ